MAIEKGGRFEKINREAPALPLTTQTLLSMTRNDENHYPKQWNSKEINIIQWKSKESQLSSRRGEAEFPLLD